MAISCVSARPSPERGFLLRSIEVEGSTRLYSLYVPHQYDGSANFPLILFLHGGGERGSEGLRPTAVGIGSAIRFNPDRWPAIVLFPQTPVGEEWAGEAESVALAVLEKTIAEFRIDPDRIYLTGMSMGGAGAWSVANQHAKRFAAVVAICGWVVPMAGRPEYARDLRESGYDPDRPYASIAENLRTMPVWIWHGDDDTVVPVEESRQMAAALRHVGAPVRYTELPGGNHNAWDPAYGNQELSEWLFAQRRIKPDAR